MSHTTCRKLLATVSQLLVIQSVTTNTGRAQSLKEAWSLVFNGVVWAEFKLLAGVALIISFGPGSCAGKASFFSICAKLNGI